MKPIYNSLMLEAIALSVTLSLQANVTSGEDTATQAVQAESLEGLKVGLISPNVSGVRDLLASGEATLDESNIIVNINGLSQGVHRLQVSAVFGTQTVVLYALDITVPTGALESETQEFDDEIVVVSTFGDGDKSGADATVYAKDGDGNAHITKPLSVGAGVATGVGAVAAGQISEDGQINANSAGSVALGSANEGAIIESGNGGAIAAGVAGGEGASIQASGAGSIAMGSVDSEGSVVANGPGSVARGSASGDGASIQASGEGAIASGSANGEGASIQAEGSGAIAGGYTNGEGASIQAEGAGSVAHGSASGDGASIQASGGGAIASGSANGGGASISATTDGAMAHGYADGDTGNLEATEKASHAFGIGVKANQIAQTVLGKCNVVDENGDYALIVGNGADNEYRSNAFAIDWNGNLVLFNAGTPVVLTPAKLAQLIA